VTGIELGAIVIGLAGGYGVVSALMGQRKRDAADIRSNEKPGVWSQAHQTAEMFPQEWNETLCISPQSSDEEIRRAYKSLIGQYHPDKVASLGPELRDLASLKAKQITAAYREAMRQRGQSA
jgi:DnaJ-domain-containing protein 1